MSAVALYTQTNTHHAQAHACLGKCQVWLTLRPRVMFKAIHLRLQGIAELIGTGTACPIGFPGLLNTSHKASTKAQPWFIVLCKRKNRGCIPFATNLHSYSIHTWSHTLSFTCIPHTCGHPFLLPVPLPFLSYIQYMSPLKCTLVYVCFLLHNIIKRGLLPCIKCLVECRIESFPGGHRKKWLTLRVWVLVH